MTGEKFFRLLLAMELSLFNFILFSVTYDGIFYERISYLLIAASFFSSVLFLYLKHMRIKKRGVVLLISGICALLISFFIGRGNFLVYLLPLISNLLLLRKKSIERLNIDYIKGVLKVQFYYMVPLVFITAIIMGARGSYLFRYYLAYIFLTILLLRQGRRAEYNLSHKSSLIGDVIILLGVTALSLDIVYKGVSKVLEGIIHGVSFLMEKLLLFVLFILKGPVESLRNLINVSPSEGQQVMEDSENSAHLVRDYINDYPMVERIIKVLVLILLFIALYSVVKRIKLPRTILEEGVFEEREKLNRNRSLPRFTRGVKRLLKNILPPNNPRERVLFYFRRLQSLGRVRAVYESFMTASEFLRALRRKLQMEDRIDTHTVAKIYNKAKFSSKYITKEESDTVEKAYKEIKSVKDEKR